MRQVRSTSHPDHRARCLVAFLPGLGDAPEKFEEEGFVRALRARAIDADVTLVDSHFGYVREETILTRLREDVLREAKEAGYEHIFLVGISLGGGLSLVLAAAEPEHVDGIVLLAPYLGERSLIREIDAAGGPRSWEPRYDAKRTRTRPDGSLTFRGLWDWSRSRTRADGSILPIYLAYGTSDRGRRAHGLFAELLPTRNVATREGGHRWTTWLPLWEDFLARGYLEARCPSGGEGVGRKENAGLPSKEAPRPR